MRHLYEFDKHQVLSKIETVYKTITERLLPSFNSIQIEANDVEQDTLERLSENFNPDYMDDADVYDQAYHAKISHFLIQTEMKEEFIKSAVTWLFHLFEKDCTYIFDTEDGNQKQSDLSNLGIDISQLSDWYICNKEMRILSNAIKHGAGNSLTQLKTIRPDLFTTAVTPFSDDKIKITENDLVKYVGAMNNFWNAVFNKVL